MILVISGMRGNHKIRIWNLKVPTHCEVLEGGYYSNYWTNGISTALVHTILHSNSASRTSRWITRKWSDSIQDRVLLSGRLGTIQAACNSSFVQRLETLNLVSLHNVYRLIRPALFLCHVKSNGPILGEISTGHVLMHACVHIHVHIHSHTGKHTYTYMHAQARTHKRFFLELSYF